MPDAPSILFGHLIGRGRVIDRLKKRVFMGEALHMSKKKVSSRLQEAIEDVEILPLDDQRLLMELIHQRLIQHRRTELRTDIAEARKAY